MKTATFTLARRVEGYYGFDPRYAVNWEQVAYCQMLYQVVASSSVCRGTWWQNMTTVYLRTSHHASVFIHEVSSNWLYSEMLRYIYAVFLWCFCIYGFLLLVGYRFIWHYVVPCIVLQCINDQRDAQILCTSRWSLTHLKCCLPFLFNIITTTSPTTTTTK